LRAARASGSPGRVYAFDPQPSNIDLVCRNADANNLQNIIAVCAAVGAWNGFIQLNLQRETDRTRLSLRLHNPNNLPIQFEVPIRRPDSFLIANSIDKVALLKIDTEGYELEVLRGLGEQIANCRNIVLEMLEGDDDERMAICDLLSSAGFELHRVDGIAGDLEIRYSSPTCGQRDHCDSDVKSDAVTGEKKEVDRISWQPLIGRPVRPVGGFDIDPSHFEPNRADLARCGAFKPACRRRMSTINLSKAAKSCRRFCAGKCSTSSSTMISIRFVQTGRPVKPHLSSGFVHASEDYGGLLDKCGSEFEGFGRHAYGPMIVVSANVHDIDV
jgi:FkbM family methyltransferase